MGSIDTRVRIILDTNVHSDWANEPCHLQPALTSRLEEALASERVELMVPGELFVEFQWPRDKQLRWLERVGAKTRNLLVLMEDVRAWEIRCAAARLRGVDVPRLRIHQGSALELYGEMRRWHPSPTVSTMGELLSIIPSIQ